MNTPSPSRQTELVRAFLDGEHFRYRRFATNGPAADEIVLDEGWQPVLHTPRTPLVERMVADFEAFCDRCMGVKLGSGSSKSIVRWHTADAGATATAIDRADRRIESFSIHVEGGQIIIEAAHQRGLLHGTHYLERWMADRGAPFLPRGNIQRTPQFSPRISNGVFIHADQKATDPGQFSDEYLSLMSHFGVNGIHLHLCLWDVCRNARLPELNSPDFERNIAGLNELNARTLRFGIDLYLYASTRFFPAEHPVFQAHPEVRGSQLEFVQEGTLHHNLCSGSETTLRCYEETLHNLFTAAPDLAGLIAIVGGEGFFHCYTRPRPPFQGHTNCPRCRDHAAAPQIARLCNRIARAVKRTGRHKRVFVWPYSAFTWSGKDRAQLRWMEKLSPDCSLLSNFDTGSTDPTNDAGVWLFDYNIKSIGPSEVFRAQARKCAASNRPIFCKTETNTTPDAFFLPYLPVHQRWHGRFRSMARTGVAGFIGQWRFYGMNGSPPEELQFHATWNPERDADSVLATMAARDFEVTAAQAKKIVAAWRKLSEAWNDLPYSAMLCGEREFYMRGPFHLGPAHPLIFNPQDHYGLGAKFRELRADLFELGTPDNLDELVRNAKPRYVSDLMMTMPFGVDRCMELMGRCRGKWSQGLARLRSVLGPKPNGRARMELDVCETVLVHLTTTENVVRFYAARDALWQSGCTRAGFKRRIASLEKIVRAEIDNARRILPILARDARIGYGHCYGVVYDAAMVEGKLRQCEHVLTGELPRLDTLIRFHLWNEYP